MNHSWIIYALLSALFAAATSVLAKLGMQNINSHLATALRTIVVLFMSWVVVFATGNFKGFESLTRTNILFLVLSGLATGASWLFYFKAIQLGEVSKVVAIDKMSIVFVLAFSILFLNEVLSLKVIIGVVLITLGTLVLAL